jgi:hypothetical protein
MRGIEEALVPLIERLDVMIELMARDRERQDDKDRQRFTTAQAAKRLNKSPWTVRRWCVLGQVRAERIRLGRSGNRLEWRIDAAEVNRVAQEGPGQEGEFANDD